MPVLDLYNQEGKKTGKITLKDEIFASRIYKDLMHEAVVSYLHNKRRGCASTKDRGEVRGGGRKPWKQKGTGRARHGSIRSPIWRGGGITFGPKPRDYRKDINKKKRILAVRSALSDKVINKALIVVEDISINSSSTKEFNKVMKNLKVNDRTLFVISKKDFNLESSASNIKNVKVVTVDSLNTYEILRCSYLVITKDSIKFLENDSRANSCEESKDEGLYPELCLSRSSKESGDINE